MIPQFTSENNIGIGVFNFAFYNRRLLSITGVRGVEHTSNSQVQDSELLD